MRTRTVGYRASPMAGTRYRMRTPSTGREIIIEAEPGEIYVDRDTGEQLEPVGMVLPLPPNRPSLPGSVEKLRVFTWCDQLWPKDLNGCPTCGRRRAPIPQPVD